MGRRGAPKKSDLFGQELIVGKGLVLLVLFPVVFYKALRSKLVYPDQASAAAVPVYYNRAQDALPFPGQKALTGIVSDSMCGAHDMAKDKSPVECTRMCVKQGMKYALVAGQQDLHAGRT